MEDTTPKMRMYTFVPYNISDKQKGIQSWHVAQKYDERYKDNEKTWDFIRNHMTGIMLDGGTTNNSQDPERRGTLNVIMDQLDANGIEHSRFYEPDLNDALTAVAFLADDRVFDFETYPDFYDWILEVKMNPEYKYAMDLKNPQIRRWDYTQFKMAFPEYYDQWVEEVMGGVKNTFLRELTKGKKLA